VALFETSEGIGDRAGEAWRLRDEGLDAWGSVEMELAAMDVLLKVGTALGRGWR